MPNDAEILGASIGLAEAVKKALNLKDRPALAVSLLVGTLLGFTYQWVKTHPTTPEAWFVAGFAGLVNGLLATGLYAITDKGITKLALGLAHRQPAKSG